MLHMFINEHHGRCFCIGFLLHDIKEKASFRAFYLWLNFDRVYISSKLSDILLNWPVKMKGEWFSPDCQIENERTNKTRYHNFCERSESQIHELKCMTITFHFILVFTVRVSFNTMTIQIEMKWNCFPCGWISFECVCFCCRIGFGTHTHTQWCIQRTNTFIRISFYR